MILAVVAVAGISILLRGGHSPTAVLGADIDDTSPPPGLVLAIPSEAATYIRSSAALIPVMAPVRAAAPPAAPAPAPAAAAATPSATAVTALAATPTPSAGATAASLDGERHGLALDDDGLLRASSPASVAESTPVPPAEPDSVVVFHEVKPGDTLSSIAQRYGVSSRSILSINEVIQDSDLLKVGLKLYIPTKDGVVTFVKWGDTVTELADKYGVKPEDIVSFKANGLSDADSIRQGELILIPGGRPPAPPPPPPPPPRAAAAPVSAPAPAARPNPALPAPAPAPVAAAAPARPASSSGFAWPINGPLSSYFGPSHPLGIDIDLYGRAGAPIAAARGGVVVFAGGNPCCSYGYYVEIDHGDGFHTLYAHFQAPPPVRIGQQVGQGQIIGYAGTTGYSTGVHLHFEIRRGGAPVNPLGYLP